jgi:hypothetical protein
MEIFRPLLTTWAWAGNDLGNTVSSLNPGRLLGRLLIRLIAPSSITVIFDGVLVDAP